MAMIRGRQVWLIVLAASLLGGCGKQVSLTFLNLTGDTLDVFVTTPQDGRKEAGLVAPMGSLQYDILIPTSQLPAKCSWQAGSYSYAFTVTKDTGDQVVNILPMGGARMRDRDASLKEELDREINPGPPAGPPPSGAQIRDNGASPKEDITRALNPVAPSLPGDWACPNEAEDRFEIEPAWQVWTPYDPAWKPLNLCGPERTRRGNPIWVLGEPVIIREMPSTMPYKPGGRSGGLTWQTCQG